MTSLLKYSKEAVYKFEYNNDATYEYHYADNILNLRFRVYNDEIIGDIPQPLHFQGTGNSEQNINAVLIAERVTYDENNILIVELLYLLPDVNVHVQMQYRKEIEFGEQRTSWSVRYLNL